MANSAMYDFGADCAEWLFDVKHNSIVVVGFKSLLAGVVLGFLSTKAFNIQANWAFYLVYACLGVSISVVSFYILRFFTRCKSCRNYFAWKLAKKEKLSEDIINDGGARYRVGEERLYYRCRYCRREEHKERRFRKRL